MALAHLDQADKITHYLRQHRPAIKPQPFWLDIFASGQKLL